MVSVFPTAAEIFRVESSYVENQIWLNLEIQTNRGQRSFNYRLKGSTPHLNKNLAILAQSQFKLNLSFNNIAFLTGLDHKLLGKGVYFLRNTKPGTAINPTGTSDE